MENSKKKINCQINTIKLKEERKKKERKIIPECLVY